MELIATTPHLLPMWDLLQSVEDQVQAVPLMKRYQIDRLKIIYYILEDLNVALADQQASSATDQAAAYLNQFFIGGELAQAISADVLRCTIDLVTGYFPRMTYLEISKARFIIVDEFTLKVTLAV